jgi:DNA-binding SARP family transcriptional activator
MLLVDQQQLSYTATEAAEVASILERDDLSSGEIKSIWSTCAGHPALTNTVLASARSGLEVEYSDGPRFAIDALATEQLNADEQTLLRVLQFLRRASVNDLQSIGVVTSNCDIGSLTKAIPLVHVQPQKSPGGPLLAAHDLICRPHLSSVDIKVFNEAGLDLAKMLSVMARQGEHARLAEFAALSQCVEITAGWLADSPEIALALLGQELVLDLICALPLGSIIRRSRLMALWARVLLELVHIEESVSKSRIACRLAAQEGDSECLALSASLVTTGLSLAGLPLDALRAGEDYLRGAAGRCSSWLECEQLAALAAAAATAGQEGEYNRAARLAQLAAAKDSARSAQAMRRVSRARATLLATSAGDWMGASRVLSPLLKADMEDDFLCSLASKGNMAACLTEIGRLSRARSLLDSIVGHGSAPADASYLPVYAMVQFVLGEECGAIESCKRGIALALKSGDEMDAHLSRITLACMERASGQLQESLDSSERAFEALSLMQVAGFKSLAVLELSASLLALGDEVACRAWVDLAGIPCSAQANYHGLRAAMILAECDRRDGDIESAIQRLAAFSAHIRSENSNWQMAMYVRTFPHLLGMLARAVGAKNLPAHMLRMVLPENAERCLRASKSIVDPDELGLLGRRLLGDERFAEFVERKGRPVCHVRLFGGLEVTSGDRQLTERDWSKRKARLLFAMLVARRGHDVSRDIVLDHLWPEMDEERGKNNFYVAWSSMKSALMPPETRSGKCPYVENVRGRCRVIRENVRSDVDEFEDLVSKARAAEAEGRTKDAIAAYSALATVYRGDLLPGDIYDDWFSTLRDKYRFEFVEAMLRAARLCDSSDAMHFLRRGLDVDPFREDLYQAALRSQIETGRRSAAIETFIQCKTQLAEELGLDPSAETIALYEQVLVMEEKSPYDFYGIGDEDFLDIDDR